MSAAPPPSEPTPAGTPGSGEPEIDPASVVTRVEGRLDELAQRFDKTDWIELMAAMVLALATVVAAWSAYQATRWGGEQAVAANRALALRSDAAEATIISAEGREIDAEFLAAWIILAAEGNTTGTAALETRLRPAFQPAFEAWLARAPTGQIPPGTPFELDEYAEYAGVEWEQALESMREADLATVAAGDANQTGDNFVLVAVIMASVLFFAGVGAKFKGHTVRLIMIALAMAFFIGGLAFMLSLPQSFGLG